MRDVASALDRLDVSRETIVRLRHFEQVLRKWNPRINLVSSASLSDLWNRHVIDSIQIYRIAPPAGHWVDMGSGGGFPGLVAAVMAAEEAPGTRFTLIESDRRKAAFLRNAAREVGISCDILADRIEAILPLEADIISARALTDLSGLLSHAKRHLGRNGVALFPKGATWRKEIAAAQRKWHFRFEPITSITDPEAVILQIEGASLV